MGRAKVRRERRQICRLAGSIGMSPKALRPFYRGQQILVNEMQAQRIIRHQAQGRPYSLYETRPDHVTRDFVVWKEPAQEAPTSTFQNLQDQIVEILMKDVDILFPGRISYPRLITPLPICEREEPYGAK